MLISEPSCADVFSHSCCVCFCLFPCRTDGFNFILNYHIEQLCILFKSFIAAGSHTVWLGLGSGLTFLDFDSETSLILRNVIMICCSVWLSDASGVLAGAIWGDGRDFYTPSFQESLTEGEGASLAWTKENFCFFYFPVNTADHHMCRWHSHTKQFSNFLWIPTSMSYNWIQFWCYLLGFTIRSCKLRVQSLKSASPHSPHFRHNHKSPMITCTSDRPAINQRVLQSYLGIW